MDPITVYDYLIKSRERVLDAVRQLTPEQYRRKFAFGLETIASTLTHIMISEWYYVERMEGRDVPPYERWPIKYENPPEFEVVERVWIDQAKRIRAWVAAARDWNRKVTWDSFPDEKGRRFHISTTTGGIFTQLALHEVHHRSQIMVMLRELGDARQGPPLEDIDFNALMYEREEIT